MSLESTLNERMLQRQSQGNWRSFSLINAGIDFASNDYLGFARNPELQKTIISSWNNMPFLQIGSTGSRLLTGNSSLAEQLEKQIASFHGSEEGILYNCGYLANLGLISAIASKEDACLYDIDIHASTHDGIKLSEAHSLPWRHNDLLHLEARLQTTQAKHSNLFVLIESIYSCDGSVAPLKEICSLCQSYNAHLIVDEAHATGVIGRDGRGLIDDLNCRSSIFASVHTFSKSLGMHGAIVLGSSLLKKILINYSRSLIYTTALPQPILIGIKEGYAKLMHTEAERTYLQSLIHYFRSLNWPSFSLIPSTTPIQSFLIPGNNKARLFAQKLSTKGFDVRALTYPTVKKGRERLRICLHAFNTTEEIDRLYRVFSEICKPRTSL
jgi:8-amino-7-oxononanoate synthase